MSTKNVLLVNAARSTSYNIALQISIRLITFVTNAFIIHYVNKDVLGVANVRLALLYSTTQFLSREPFRKACLGKEGQADWHTTVNFLWLTVPLSIVFGWTLRLVWLYLLVQPDENLIPGYNRAVDLIFLSVVVEMLAEPLFVLTQISQFVKLKVFVEGFSLVCRCLTMASLLAGPYRDFGVLAFGLGHLISAIFYTTFYYSVVLYHLLSNSNALPIAMWRELFPERKENKWLNPDQTRLTLSFLKQSLVKQVLTEGERYIMSFFNVLTFTEQGVYDVVNNLGSLAARFVFQPIEESAYIFFAQTVVRGEKTTDPFVSHVLRNVFKIMAILGYLVMAFGLAYSSDLLFLYGGPELAGHLGTRLLQWNCVYIVFLAINGPTEGFVFATMNSKAIEHYNGVLVLLSLCFLTVAFGFTRIFGSVGFIYANSFCMAVRIAHSLSYIKRYFGNSENVRALLIHPGLALTLLFCNQILWISGLYLDHSKGSFFLASHIALGTVGFAFTLFMIYILEGTLLKFINSFFIKKQV